MKPKVKDFARLFAVAKAHGFSVEDLRQLILVELGKSLGQITKEEILAFEFRICRGRHEGSHV